MNYVASITARVLAAIGDESHLLPPHEAGEHMCYKCDEIDRKIVQFQRLATPGMDALSLKMMREAIKLLEAEKLACICDDEPLE